MEESHSEYFCVWQEFTDHTIEKVRDWVTAQEAVDAARHYTNNVAVRMGIVQRVWIVDTLDTCVFEWQKGKGVIHPRMQ